jgi:hypothetical protein
MTDSGNMSGSREGIQVGGRGHPPAGRNIQGGMDVFDSSAHQIGNVTELFLQPGIAPDEVGDHGQEARVVGYFKMLELGTLHLGIINAKELYIPFSAVESVDPARMRLTLSCTKEEAEQRYEKEPEFVSSS